MNRYYGMATGRAGVAAAVFVLIGGIGMVVCGALTDRLSRNSPSRKFAMAIVFCAMSLVFLGLGFHLPQGGPQLVLIAVGMFFSAGTAGPASVMEIGRASCRARVCPSVSLSDVAVQLRKKTTN